MAPRTLPASLRLGPAPVASIRALAELGLSEMEIARYFSIDRKTVASFRDADCPSPRGIGPRGEDHADAREAHRNSGSNA